MKQSSSRSDDLFGPLFGAPEVDAELTGRAWLQAMLDVEGALATAQAGAGLVPYAAAEAIAQACTADRFDIADLAQRALAAGNPVVPLVRDLGARLHAEAARFVHLGATSQDILDSATSLVAARALDRILAALDSAAEAAARLAAEHRGTPMVGRTLLRQAVPITFGLKCAGWLMALDEAAAGLRRVRHERLAVQYGGAAGTLATIGNHGPAVLAVLAGALGLAEPVLPWHTDRTRIAELATSLGTASGVLAKIALDVALLAQSEVAEVAEATGGGSSAMPHKQNPVRAVLVSAGTRRVPGLVATLLATMAQEHERAAGAWHAEWETVTELLRLAGGAAAGTRDLLAGLRVDTDRMRHNLDAGGGSLMAEAVAARLAGALGRNEAHDLVARLVHEARDRDVPAREALLDDPVVRAHLSTSDIDAALEPGNHLGAADQFISRALAAHEERGWQPTE
jgi:3-carboxy-cis,cis-muconate cycloisomerase